MDFVRSCYSTYMQFDQAGQVVAKVQWYFAEPGAKLWHGPNAFCSANWDEVKYSTLGLGEVYNAARDYSKGALPFPSPGTGRWCGKHRYFSEGVPSDAEPLPLGPNGQPLCCGGPVLLIGGTSKLRGRYQAQGGLQIGGTSTVPMSCQPVDTNMANWGASTLLQETGSVHWLLLGYGSVIASFYLTAEPYEFTFFTNSSTPCSGNFAITEAIFKNPPNTYNLIFVSYNPTTKIGRWQVPSAGSPFANQYFDFYFPV
jgi:hypothetical protein